jgi:hypothetical protein
MSWIDDVLGEPEDFPLEPELAELPEHLGSLKRLPVGVIRRLRVEQLDPKTTRPDCLRAETETNELPAGGGDGVGPAPTGR